MSVSVLMVLVSNFSKLFRSKAVGVLKHKSELVSHLTKSNPQKFGVAWPTVLADRTISISKCSIINPTFICSEEISSYWFSFFSLFFICRHTGSKFTGIDRNGPNYRIGSDCESRAWLQ